MNTGTAASIARQLTAHPGTHERAYSSAQLQTAWKMLCQKEKSSISRREAEQLLRFFFPNMSTYEFEQVRHCTAHSKNTVSVKPQILATVAFGISEFNHSQQVIGPIQGRLTYSELKSLMQSDVLPPDYDPVLAAFRVFDRDHSSIISAEEMCHFVSQMPGIGNLSAEDIRVVMHLTDKDRDGKISVDDFREVLGEAFDTRALQRFMTRKVGGNKSFKAL